MLGGAEDADGCCRIRTLKIGEILEGKMMPRMWMRAVMAGICAMGLGAGAVCAQQAAGYRFSVSFSGAQSADAIDGTIAADAFDRSVGRAANANQQFDAHADDFRIGCGWDEAGASVTLDDAAFGYPVRYLHDVPAGDYFVQVVLHRYETFHRADGHTVKLPMDRGEGQHWHLAPGNLYSKAQKITLRSGGDPFAIVLDQVIAPIPEPKDTTYVRHIKIQSELLTKWWGRPMFLSANVLVPEGFDAHPKRIFR